MSQRVTQQAGPVGQAAVVALGLGIGFYFAGLSAALHESGHPSFDHTNRTGAGAMNHAPIEVGHQGPVPRLVGLSVDKDPMAGWNVHVQTDNFQFTPQSASTAHVPTEGHAHLLIDGVKTARLYGPWFHLASLPSDARSITVTLNANTHGVMMVDGEALSMSVPLPGAR